MINKHLEIRFAGSIFMPFATVKAQTEDSHGWKLGEKKPG
jgi:hypothetical protein